VTLKQPGSVPDRHNLQFIKISFIKVAPAKPSKYKHFTQRSLSVTPICMCSQSARHDRPIIDYGSKDGAPDEDVECGASVFMKDRKRSNLGTQYCILQNVEVVRRPEGTAPALPALNVTALQSAATRRLEVTLLHACIQILQKLMPQSKCMSVMGLQQHQLPSCQAYHVPQI
jgi:hypothetical protein